MSFINEDDDQETVGIVVFAVILGMILGLIFG